MLSQIQVNKTRDYARNTEYISGQVNHENFSINIYPDTSKTLLGQKRQVLKVARIIAKTLENPKFMPRHSKPYEIWSKDWQERMYKYHTVGPSPDYITYVSRLRRKSRLGYVADSILNVSITWKHNWWDARAKTWQLGNLIAEKLNRYANKSKRYRK